MKITDEQIKEYCKRMNYELILIKKISFTYKKPDGSYAGLLKAAAGYNKKIHSTEKSELSSRSVTYE